jgi:O-acetyl-ADP-ribose deacetylase (regulator of RNase III)
MSQYQHASDVFKQLSQAAQLSVTTLLEQYGYDKLVWVNFSKRPVLNGWFLLGQGGRCTHLPIIGYNVIDAFAPETWEQLQLDDGIHAWYRPAFSKIPRDGFDNYWQQTLVIHRESTWKIWAKNPAERYDVQVSGQDGGSRIHPIGMCYHARDEVDQTGEHSRNWLVRLGECQTEWSEGPWEGTIVWWGAAGCTYHVANRGYSWQYVDRLKALQLQHQTHHVHTTTIIIVAPGTEYAVSSRYERTLATTDGTAEQNKLLNNCAVYRRKDWVGKFGVANFVTSAPSVPGVVFLDDTQVNIAPQTGVWFPKRSTGWVPPDLTAFITRSEIQGEIEDAHHISAGIAEKIRKPRNPVSQAIIRQGVVTAVDAMDAEGLEATAETISNVFENKKNEKVSKLKQKLRKAKTVAKQVEQGAGPARAAQQHVAEAAERLEEALNEGIPELTTNDMQQDPKTVIENLQNTIDASFPHPVFERNTHKLDERLVAAASQWDVSADLENLIRDQHDDDGGEKNPPYFPPIDKNMLADWTALVSSQEKDMLTQDARLYWQHVVLSQLEKIADRHTLTETQLDTIVADKLSKVGPTALQHVEYSGFKSADSTQLSLQEMQDIVRGAWKHVSTQPRSALLQAGSGGLSVMRPGGMYDNTDCKLYKAYPDDDEDDDIKWGLKSPTQVGKDPQKYDIWSFDTTTLLSAPEVTKTLYTFDEANTLARFVENAKDDLAVDHAIETTIISMRREAPVASYTALLKWYTVEALRVWDLKMGIEKSAMADDDLAKAYAKLDALEKVTIRTAIRSEHIRWTKPLGAASFEGGLNQSRQGKANIDDWLKDNTNEGHNNQRWYRNKKAGGGGDCGPLSLAEELLYHKPILFGDGEGELRTARVADPFNNMVLKEASLQIRRRVANELRRVMVDINTVDSLSEIHLTLTPPTVGANVDSKLTTDIKNTVISIYRTHVNVQWDGPRVASAVNDTPFNESHIIFTKPPRQQVNGDTTFKLKFDPEAPITNEDVENITKHLSDLSLTELLGWTVRSATEFSGQKDADKEDQIQEMLRWNGWIDEPFLTAFANEFKCNIVLAKTKHTGAFEWYSYPDEIDQALPELRLYHTYDSVAGGQHYEPVFRMPDDNGLTTWAHVRLRNGATLVLSHGDLAKFTGTAIVNAANEDGRGGGGIDGQLNNASEQLRAYRARQLGYSGESTGNRLKTGEVIVDTATDEVWEGLHVKHVIEAAPPKFKTKTELEKLPEAEQQSDRKRDFADLENTYKAALTKFSEIDETANSSIAFCLLSGDIFSGGDDNKPAIRDSAFRSLFTHASKLPNNNKFQIHFVVYDDPKVRSEKDRRDMGAQYVRVHWNKGAYVPVIIPKKISSATLHVVLPKPAADLKGTKSKQQSKKAVTPPPYTDANPPQPIGTRHSVQYTSGADAEFVLAIVGGSLTVDFHTNQPERFTADALVKEFLDTAGFVRDQELLEAVAFLGHTKYLDELPPKSQQTNLQPIKVIDLAVVKSWKNWNDIKSYAKQFAFDREFFIGDESDEDESVAFSSEQFTDGGIYSKSLLKQQPTALKSFWDALDANVLRFLDHGADHSEEKEYQRWMAMTEIQKRAAHNEVHQQNVAWRTSVEESMTSNAKLINRDDEPISLNRLHAPAAKEAMEKWFADTDLPPGYVPLPGGRLYAYLAPKDRTEGFFKRWTELKINLGILKAPKGELITRVGAIDYLIPNDSERRTLNSPFVSEEARLTGKQAIGTLLGTKLTGHVQLNDEKLEIGEKSYWKSLSDERNDQKHKDWIWTILTKNIETHSNFSKIVGVSPGPWKLGDILTLLPSKVKVKIMDVQTFLPPESDEGMNQTEFKKRQDVFNRNQTYLDSLNVLVDAEKDPSAAADKFEKDYEAKITQFNKEFEVQLTSELKARKWFWGECIFEEVKGLGIEHNKLSIGAFAVYVDKRSDEPDIVYQQGVQPYRIGYSLAYVTSKSKFKILKLRQDSTNMWHVRDVEGDELPVNIASVTDDSVEALIGKLQTNNTLTNDQFPHTIWFKHNPLCDGEEKMTTRPAKEVMSKVVTGVWETYNSGKNSGKLGNVLMHTRHFYRYALPDPTRWTPWDDPEHLIHEQNFHTLEGSTYIDGRIVQSYSQLCQRRSDERNETDPTLPKVAIFDTNAHATMLMVPGKSERLWRNARLQSKIWEMDLLIFPLHPMSGSHWAVAAVDMKKHLVSVYDSIHHSTNLKAQVTPILTWLAQTNRIPADADPLNWKKVSVTNYPQQRDTHCGVYAMLCILQLSHAKNIDKFPYEEDDMASFRIQIGYELLADQLVPWVDSSREARVFVVAHPVEQEDQIIAMSLKYIGGESINLISDATVNVWENKPELYDSFDAIWLPDLVGGFEEIKARFVFLDRLLRKLTTNGHLFIVKSTDEGYDVPFNDFLPDGYTATEVAMNVSRDGEHATVPFIHITKK